MGKTETEIYSISCIIRNFKKLLKSFFASLTIFLKVDSASVSKVFKISPTLWFDDILCEINYSLINFDMKSLFNCFRHLWNHRMRFYLFTLRIRESGFAGELWAGISNTACPHTKCVWVVTFLNYETVTTNTIFFEKTQER